MSSLTAARARELLDYDPETGVLTWRRPVAHPRFAGRVAGTVHDRRRPGPSYISLQVDGKKYLGHRLAWLIVYGNWPQGIIDHINGDGTDNRLRNLREATGSQNQHNSRLRSDSSTGLKGVSISRRENKYRATIKRNGRQVYLGLFSTAQEAHAAYCEAADELHGEFANYGGQR